MSEVTLLVVMLFGGTCAYQLGVERGRRIFREEIENRIFRAIEDPEILDDPDWPGSSMV